MRILLLVSLLVMAACDTTIVTKSFCANNEANVGIEGVYELSLFGEKVGITFTKLSDVGMYKLSYIDDGDLEEAEMKTCVTDGQVYAEGIDEEEEYSSVFKLTSKSNGLLMESLMLDTKKLDALGIPYIVEDNEFGSETVFLSNENVDVKVLLSTETSDGDPISLDLIKL